MIQLTHLGRRTGWNKADWLPVLAPSPVREPAHRSFPKEIEDWDIERIVARLCRAPPQRMQAAGLDGIEFEAYGHLMDGFWSPATNRRDRRIRRLARQPAALHLRRCSTRSAPRSAPTSSSASAWSPTRTGQGASSREEGLEIARRLAATGMIDFLNVIRGHIDTDAGAADVIPITGMRSAPHLDFAGEVRAATDVPGLPRRAHQRRRDRAPRDRRRASSTWSA